MRSLAAAFLFLLPVFPCGQLPLLPTEWDALDGGQHDMAGPSAAMDSMSPDFLRMFLANGRRRAAHVVSDRTRQFGGEETYDTPIIAVELDEENDLLISVTKAVFPQDPLVPLIAGRLFVDDVGEPSAPVPEGDVPLYKFGSPGVPSLINAVRAIPSLKLVIITHPAESDGGVIVNPSSFELYDYDPSSPTFLQRVGGAELPSISTCQGTGVFVSLGQAEVAVLGGQRIAFFRATIKYTGGRGKPQPRGIVACDLTSPTTPSFFTTAAHVFDPVEAYFSCPPPLDAVAQSLSDFVHVQMGGGDFLCIVGGQDLQFRVVAVTNFPTSGFALLPGVEKQLDYSLCDVVVPSGTENLIAIVSDPLLPYKYVVSQNYIYALDLSDPQNIQYECTAANFGRGLPGFLCMLEGPDAAPETTVWTTHQELVDYKWKITNMTNAPPGQPDVNENLYAAGGIDGIVALLEVDSVYVPTFGGLVRYDVSTGDPIPDDDSYQPALDQATGIVQRVEEIDLGYVQSLSEHRWHVVGQAALGGFVMWRLDDQTRDPMPAEYVDGVAAHAFQNWPDNEFAYGSDIAFGQDATKGDFVLIDHFNVPQNLISINRYFFVDPDPVDPTQWDGELNLTPAGTTVSVPVFDITIDGDYAFVTGNFGFFVVDLPNWALVDEVVTSDAGLPVCGKSFTAVQGIARYQDKLIVSMSQAGSIDQFGLAVYDFDELTGQVSGPTHCLFDGEGMPDDFPGIYVTGGGRVRLIEMLDGTVRVYVGTLSGHLLELELQGGLLTPIAYWHDGSFWGEISDNPIYEICAQPTGSGFGPTPNCEYRILAARSAEGWASVVPTGFH